MKSSQSEVLELTFVNHMLPYRTLTLEECHQRYLSQVAIRIQPLRAHRYLYLNLRFRYWNETASKNRKEEIMRTYIVFPVRLCH
jgi:hypothetical protein